MFEAKNCDHVWVLKNYEEILKSSWPDQEVNDFKLSNVHVIQKIPLTDPQTCHFVFPNLILKKKKKKKKKKRNLFLVMGRLFQHPFALLILYCDLFKMLSSS